jgi:peptidyl-prolyl cis-trans isomerase B (cyclophilin B)
MSIPRHFRRQRIDIEIPLQSPQGIFNIPAMKKDMLLPALLLALGLSLPLPSSAKTSPTPATAPAKSQVKKEKPVLVKMETSMGVIEMELDAQKAPITVKNFMNYVDRKYYDDLVFHRVIDDFMIQGGGFDKDLKLRPSDAGINNEAGNGLKNLKGTVAMARTPAPHSASSQFFINLKDNAFLDYKNPTPQGFGYAVFGKVTKGMDVVEKIGKVQTTASGSMRDVPAEPVMIKSIRKVEEK